MGEPQVGGNGSEVAHVGSGGGQSTGPGGAPAIGVPSTPPVGGSYAPETVRAILSGIWTPADAAAAESPLAPATPLEGVLDVRSADQVLPDLVARAAATHTPLTVVLARPGAQTAASVAPGVMADLASALSVSLAPDQHLLQAGPGHLAVVLRGGPGAGRRQAQRLMERAALAGAPMLTWAMASHPRDGATASALLATATARLQHPVDERAGAGPAAWNGRAALWAGVAAALLAGVFAYTFGAGHGSSPSQAGASGSRQAGLAAAGGSAPAGGGSTGEPSVAGTPSSWVGSGTDGTTGTPASGSGTASGSGSASGSANDNTGGGSGSTGSFPGLPGGGDGQQQATGTTPTTTLPLNLTTPTIPISTTTTAPSSGGGTPTAGTTDNQCSGLLQGLVCTVNGLLGH